MTNITLIAQTVNAVIDKNEFSRIVREHDSDKGCKVYTTWCQFVWMLICHLGDCRSIRDVSNILQSTTGNLNHLGMAAAPSKSSVAYQNAHRDWRVFRDLYYLMLKSLGQHLPFKMDFPDIKRRIKLMDSTTVTFSLTAFPWAEYSREKGAIKIHTALDFEQDVPSFLLITDGKEGDNEAAAKLPFTEGMVVVADRGYMDFKLLKLWDSTKVEFVVRHAPTIAYKVVEERELPRDTPANIVSDEVILMTGKHSSDYGRQMRRVVAYNEEHGYNVTLLTNNFEWSAATVAALYKDRWYIETFFRSIKQLLRIKSFIGTTANAVLTQVWTAMCAILILKYLAAKSKVKWNLSNLVHFLRVNLFVKIDLWYWLDYPLQKKKPPKRSAGLKQGVLF